MVICYKCGFHQEKILTFVCAGCQHSWRVGQDWRGPIKKPIGCHCGSKLILCREEVEDMELAKQIFELELEAYGF